MEFSFTTVSVSDEATMPTIEMIPKMVKTMPARITPKRLAKVNFINSFMSVLYFLVSIYINNKNRRLY